MAGICKWTYRCGKRADFLSKSKVDLHQGVTKIGTTQLLLAADNEHISEVKDLLLHPKTIVNFAN